MECKIFKLGNVWFISPINKVNASKAYSEAELIVSLDTPEIKDYYRMLYNKLLIYKALLPFKNHNKN